MEQFESSHGHSNHYPDADLPIAGSLDGWHSRYDPLLVWWEEFAEIRESIPLDYRHNTARAYWGDLEDVAFWCAERDLNPLKLTEKQIRQYLALLRRRKYSENTVRRRVTVMRKLYDVLVDQSKLDSNPARRMVVRRSAHASGQAIDVQASSS